MFLSIHQNYSLTFANVPQCLIIGKDAKDVSREEALDYVGAYTAGNDISSRKLQRDVAFAGRIPQWGFSKGFDTFAPLGPCLVSPDLVGDPAGLQLKTVVNGEGRQEESVGDLLFDCAYLISYLSSGTTLRKGSVIMTGTPGGELLPLLILEDNVANLLTLCRCRCRFEPAAILGPGYYDGGFY